MRHRSLAHQMTELNPMSSMRASGRWSRFASRIRSRFATLNDEDLEPYMGDREQLIGQIAEQTQAPRHEVEEHIAAVVTAEGDIWMAKEAR
ncbi:MAG: hypothetical protein AAF730_17745 [Bacteroidota bacterium]